MSNHRFQTATCTVGFLALVFVLGCAPDYDAPPEDPEEHIDDDPIPDEPPEVGGVAGDLDGDGFSAPQDCDDHDPDIYPGAPEYCDDIDNDCSGVVDDGYDMDGDGFTACGGDCDDYDGRIYPGAPDLCDGVLDNNCDGYSDPMETDNDLDSFSECNGDCDDEDELTYPGAPDVCDAAWDNDCDGAFDALDIDNDLDGYSECNGDCDDTDAMINPMAIECANGVDDDCDGFIDEE